MNEQERPHSPQLQYWLDEAKHKNPHDRFFKLGMDNRQVVLELMEDLLPPALRDLCDLSRYELIKQGFVGELLSERVTDVLIKLPTREGGTMYTYILWEHFRTVDPLAAFRDWGYKHAIAEYHMRQTDTQEVPLIHTLMFYNGQAPYTAAQKLTDLVRGPKEQVAEMFSGYQLVDLSHIPDEAFAHRIWSRLFQTALKHIDDPKALEKIAEMADHLREVGSSSGGIKLLGALVRYLLCAGPGPPQETVLERVKALLPGETGEVMMTFVERIQNIGEQKGVILGVKQGVEIGVKQGVEIGVKQGVEIGVKQGVEIGVKQGVEQGQNSLFLYMFRQGFSAESIAQMTGGSLAQILKVQDAMDKEVLDSPET